MGSQSNLQVENQQFRVVQWTIDPGGYIPMHQHNHDYVVVPLVNALMHVINEDGSEQFSELRAGESYSRSRGTIHQVENRNSHQTISFIEIERL